MLLDLMVSLAILRSEGIAIDRTMFCDRSHVSFGRAFYRMRSIATFRAIDRAIDRTQGREQFILSILHDRSHPVWRSIATLLFEVFRPF